MSLFFLLEEYGIHHDQVEFQEMFESTRVVQEPIPIYQGCNEELYEFWDNYGPSTEQHPMVMDYQQELDYAQNLKKIHRYDRKERFRYTLYQLVGASGTVPASLCKAIKEANGKRVRKSRVWNMIRNYLKRNKLRQHYNRIPQIISRIYKLKPLNLTGDIITNIFKDFHCFHYQFNNDLRFKWKRSYFPNLRFVALKLLEKYGVQFPYSVPLVRTLRKRKYLNNLYNDFE
jgi:hypothetical protein